MIETIRIEDMRRFAEVAAKESFTAAAASLGIPKQTLSRRIAELERSLGVALLHRTTRRVRLTDAGAPYAERCAAIVRAAIDANRELTVGDSLATGTLRIGADPILGDAFLSPLVVAFARHHPAVRIEVALSRHKADLVDERLDLAFRVGTVEDDALVARRLGAARVLYCASRRYIRARGAPERASDLAKHDCVVIASDGVRARWPVIEDGALRTTTVEGRIVTSSFAMMREAVLAGLGVGLFPAFACAADVRAKRLVTVLGAASIEVGSVWLVRPAHRFVSASVKLFSALAIERARALQTRDGAAVISAPSAR